MTEIKTHGRCFLPAFGGILHCTDDCQAWRDDGCMWRILCGKGESQSSIYAGLQWDDVVLPRDFKEVVELLLEHAQLLSYGMPEEAGKIANQIRERIE